MVELNEPQVWTLIGVFAAGTFAMIGLVSTTFVRILRAEIGGLGGEMNGLRGEMNARFERMEDRLDHLDRDLQAIARRVFPE